MSASHPPKLDYATPGSDRGPWSATLERLAYGSAVSWAPVVGAVVGISGSLTLAPSVPLDRVVLFGPLLLASGLLWALLALTRGWLVVTRRGRLHVSRSSRLAFAAFPVLILLGTVALQMLLVPRLAAWISTSAADRLLQASPAATLSYAFPDQRIGVFRAGNIQRIPGGVTFSVGTTGFFGVYGYCYTEAGNPRPPSEWQGPTILHHLGGNWWLWEWVD